MTASERSFVGLAKQSAKGEPITADAAFQYFLYTDGGISPQNMFTPLDQEIGGGAMLRDVIKTGVTSAGMFTFIPRPEVIGHFLLGALGNVGEPVQQGATTAYLHTFTLPVDQFDAPYYTFRSAPGNMWGEQFEDCRAAALGLDWRAADYLRGTVGVMGGLPLSQLSTETWGVDTRIDSGPQFLAPKATIELPTGSDIKVLSGSFEAGMDIPLDEQFVTGSYSPDDFDINSRSYTLNLVVKITDPTLYDKMNYDPAGGASWAADVFREADILFEFLSDKFAGTAIPYELAIEANGQSGDNANVSWSVQPIRLRAGRQVTMVVSGQFLASPTVAAPITISLVNQRSTQY